MDKIALFLTEKLLPNIAFIVVGGIAIATTSAVAFSISSNLPAVAPINVAKDAQKNSSSSTLAGTDNSNKCIVTISGNTYDVTILRNTHSGGDVFLCGTDMTTTYLNQHGTNLERMKSYLVTGTTASISTSSTASAADFTLATLAQHNKRGDCYIAYNGTVYNVSNHPSWGGCFHHGISGGQDITSRFPHSTSYLASLPVVGKLTGGATAPANGGGRGGEDRDEQEGREIEGDDD